MSRSPWSVRLTGTAVVSWTGFWVLLPYFVVSIFLANADLAGAGAATLVVVAVLIEAVLFALLLLWRRAAHRWPLLSAAPWRVALAFVVVSTVRAVVLALVLDGLGLTTTIDWPRRLVVSVPWVATALVVLDLAIGSVRRHRQRVEALLARQEQGRRALAAAIEAIATQRQELSSVIHDELVSRLARITVDDDPARALDTLTSTAEDFVRPISHQLAGSSPPVEPVALATGRRPFDLRAFLDDATRGRPLSPGWTVLLGAAIVVPLLVASLPPAQAALLTATGLALVWLTMTASNAVIWWVTPRVSLAARVAVVAALLTLATLVMAGSGLVLAGASSDVSRRIVATEVLIPITAAVALACARAVRIQDETIESRLEQAARDLDWATARSNGVRWREQRALARAMHGPVQGAIASAAIRLERAIQAGRADGILVDELRSQVISACARIGDGAASASTVATALDEFAATWRGVCRIDSVIDDDATRDLATDPVAGFAVRELACEACWNALRHARPTLVRVRVSAVGGRVIRVVVDDDGRPSPDSPAGRGGLGARMLDDMALSWQRVSTEDGTTVTFDVPVQAPSGAAER